MFHLNHSFNLDKKKTILLDSPVCLFNFLVRKVGIADYRPLSLPFNDLLFTFVTSLPLLEK